MYPDRTTRPAQVRARLTVNATEKAAIQKVFLAYQAAEQKEDRVLLVSRGFQDADVTLLFKTEMELTSMKVFDMDVVKYLRRASAGQFFAILSDPLLRKYEILRSDIFPFLLHSNGRTLCKTI